MSRDKLPTGYGVPTKAYVDSQVRTVEEQLWIDIVQAAKSDPGLTDLLNQVIMYYLLRKNNGC